MNELEIRSSTLTEVDSKQRLIDLIAVPYEQETDVEWNGDVWREVFARGAFAGIEDHAGRIRVNREHRRGDTVGKIVHLDPNHADGLFSRVKIASTARGDETLALAEEDMISASIGFYVKTRSDMQVNKRTKVRKILRAFLDHLSMVEAPAYAGAQVLAVREEPSGLSVVTEPLPETPLLDDAVNNPILVWARERVSS